MADVLEIRHKRIKKAQIITLIIGVALVIVGFSFLGVGQRMEIQYHNSVDWESVYLPKVNRIYEYSAIFLAYSIILSLLIELILYVIKITMYIKPQQKEDYSEKHIGYY